MKKVIRKAIKNIKDNFVPAINISNTEYPPVSQRREPEVRMATKEKIAEIAMILDFSEDI